MYHCYSSLVTLGSHFVSRPCGPGMNSGTVWMKTGHEILLAQSAGFSKNSVFFGSCITKRKMNHSNGFSVLCTL